MYSVWWIILIVVLVIITIVILAQILVLLSQCTYGVWKYFIVKERNLPQRYGPDSWVVITGASSGQGREFAHAFAKRGFNLCLIGSERTSRVIGEIKNEYPGVKTKSIVVDFGRAFEDNFFEPIERELSQLDVSILVNNVGHRTAWIGYENMPPDEMRNTIASGTMVQARLTQILLPSLLKRSSTSGSPTKKRSAVVFITAQCQHPDLGFGASNEFSVPYLSIYEASNAWGYYHATSLNKEYGDRLDILNITPGAVVTENTQFLKNTMFAIDAKKFVNNVMRLIGNVNGTSCAHWGHAFSMYFAAWCPWKKHRELDKTGKIIAENYMANFGKRKYSPPSGKEENKPLADIVIKGEGKLDIVVRTPREICSSQLTGNFEGVLEFH